MRVKGNLNTYDIIQVIRDKSNQAVLELQLINESWLVEFQSVYKAF